MDATCHVHLVSPRPQSQWIGVAIEGMTMLRTWCFEKNHIKLIITCFLHMPEWYEEVWIRMIALKKAFYLRDVHIWWLLYPFSSLRRFISNSPIVLHHTILRNVCLAYEWFQWQRQGSWSQRLAIWFVQILIELTKSCVFHYEKQEKLICHWLEVSDLFSDQYTSIVPL